MYEYRPPTDVAVNGPEAATVATDDAEVQPPTNPELPRQQGNIPAKWYELFGGSGPAYTNEE